MLNENEIVDNFLNGNHGLEFRKHVANNFNSRQIRLMFMEHAGYSFEKSALIAEWIVDGTGYQEMCDA
jgi:hypothetical protein